MKGAKFYDVNYLEDSSHSSVVSSPWIYEPIDSKPNLAPNSLYVVLRDSNLVDVYTSYPSKYPLGYEVYQVALGIELKHKRTSTNHRYPLHPSSKMYNTIQSLVSSTGLSQADMLRKLIVMGADNNKDLVVPDDWRIWKRGDSTLTVRLNDYEHSLVEKVRLPKESNLGIATRLIYLGINTYCQNLDR